MSKKNPVLIIAGPTGSGKTALALDLAGAFSGTVINADSMQVYDELRILTARPCCFSDRRIAFVRISSSSVLLYLVTCSSSSLLFLFSSLSIIAIFIIFSS